MQDPHSSVFNVHARKLAIMRKTNFNFEIFSEKKGFGNIILFRSIRKSMGWSLLKTVCQRRCTIIFYAHCSCL